MTPIVGLEKNGDNLRLGKQYIFSGGSMLFLHEIPDPDRVETRNVEVSPGVFKELQVYVTVVGDMTMHWTNMEDV